MPHRYLRRHLKYPGLYGRTGQEKKVWLNLHKTEHERLLATLGLAPFHNPNPNEVLEVNRADPVNIIKLVEDNNEEEGNSRTGEFELRARSMGITEEKLIAQKVAIWEGMWAAQQSGDDIGVSIIFLHLLRGYSRIVADMGG